MNPKFSPLFNPYTLNNHVVIKNRLVVAPMTHFASNADGSLSTEEKAFLQGRAEDFGLFITAATLVSPEGKAFVGQPEAVSNKDLPSLDNVAKIIKAQGAKAILQIHHGGKLSKQELLNGAEMVAPTEDEVSGARELTDLEILALINAFANAADLAIQAGFDGVEIHGANGYLIQQFNSAQSNQRNDEWGGNVENRMRFSLEVINAIDKVKQKYHREDFIIGYRFSPEEPGDDGLTMLETFALIDALTQQPLQYLHVSLWDFYNNVRRGADTNLTRIELLHARIAGKLPLIGVGNLISADQVLEAYKTGWSDFIAVGKTVMINPNFATLIVTGSEDKIMDFIDPHRNDYYRIPQNLWEQNMQRLSYLPNVKDDVN